jgi:hypothetical protein
LSQPLGEGEERSSRFQTIPFAAEDLANVPTDHSQTRAISDSSISSAFCDQNLIATQRTNSSNRRVKSLDERASEAATKIECVASRLPQD